jgi:hypothetical protein
VSDTSEIVRYEPDGEVLRAFINDDNFITGIMGPYGSGKSTACVIKVLRHALEQTPNAQGVRASRWAVVRNTYPELRTTTLPTWFQWMPRDQGVWREQGPPMHSMRMLHPDGKTYVELEVLFLALDQPDDIRKLLSLELTGVWINEAREILKGVLDACTGRVGRFPRGGGKWSGIIMDSNPPDTDHWWYIIAEEDVSTDFGRQMVESISVAENMMREAGLLGNTDRMFRFHKQPGGMDPKAENTRNLVPGYYARQLAGKQDDWVNVYVHGNYGFVRDGKPIMPEYNDSIHCKPVEPISSLPLIIGVDFGLTPAAVICQRDYVGNWRVLDEIASIDMGAVRFSNLLARTLTERYARFKIEKVWGDPSGDIRSQTDERTPFMILRTKGLPARPTYTNDFTIRREAVAQMLTRLHDGVPSLIIHPRCQILRKGMMGAYRYRRMQVAGREQYADRPEKGPSSHACEALQYALVGGGEGKALFDTARTKRERYAETDAAVYGTPSRRGAFARRS